MIRDPHYRAILDRLSETGLDHDAFERCAQDLLRGIYPGLTPVAGGSDLGMDGLDTSDPDAPKILVATTSQEVRRNLVRNLQSHKSQSDSIQARHVVVATTQPATGSLHESLRKAASGEDFHLVNVHGREAFADLLYRSRRWARELLGLRGVPSALSAVPASSRPMDNLPLIGREADRQWLADSSGDVGISGHPASGKTHLLRHFVDQGWLFMVDTDRQRLADALRDLDPEVVIADDAHADLDSLRSLRQLRSAIGAEFRIAAVTWPGDKDEVASALGVPAGSVLDLQRLSADETLEIIRAAGIAGPIELQREIVLQSAGLPGLTATLCGIAIQGDIRALFSGELLLRETRIQVDEDTGMQVLAVIALAGDNGSSLVDVHSILGVSAAELRNLLTRLGHLGVFRTTSLDDKVTVWPKGLRFAAVGAYFFADNLYENIPFELAKPHLDERSMLKSLLGAALRGAQVPYETIESMLLRSGTHDDFGGYAGVGKIQASFALKTRPEWLTEIAPYSLLTNPEETIPRLLEKAAEPSCAGAYEADPPIRIIKRWIQSAPDIDNEQIERRRILVRLTTKYARNAGDPQVALEALCLATNPQYTEHGKGASSGYYGRYSLASRNCLTGIAELWPDILDAMPTNGIQNYSVVLSMLYEWEDCRPSSVEINVPEDVCEWMRSQASIMANDIALHFVRHTGVISRIEDLSRSLRFELNVQVPREFETIFPTLETTFPTLDQAMENIESQRCMFRERARSLAAELQSQDPCNVLSMLLETCKSATEAGIPTNRGENMTGEFADELARRVSDPCAWAAQALGMGFDQIVVGPLLSAARSANRERALPLIVRALELETARAAAVEIVLTAEDPDDDEVEETLDAVSRMEEASLRLLICPLIKSGNIPTDTLRRLFCHPSAMVAGVAASQVRIKKLSWLVQEHLIDHWKSAVLRSNGAGEISDTFFVACPGLFFNWLAVKISERMFSQVLEVSEETIVRDHVFPKLSSKERVDILYLIEEHDASALDSLISLLIGDDDTVFCKFLTMDNMHPVHEKVFGPASEKKIKAACVAGWDAEKIVRAILFHSGIWSDWAGHESGHWQAKLEYFSKLAKNRDLDVSAVGRAGCELTHELRKAARSREIAEDVYGR